MSDLGKPSRRAQIAEEMRRLNAARPDDGVGSGGSGAGEPEAGAAEPAGPAPAGLQRAAAMPQPTPAAAQPAIAPERAADPEATRAP